MKKNQIFKCFLPFFLLLFIAQKPVAQIADYRPIQYVEGDNLAAQFHAWAVILYPTLPTEAYLNARITNMITGQTDWLIQNFPILPNATPREVRYRMNMASVSELSMPEMILIEAHIGEFVLDATFPATILDTKIANPENHFVPTGGPRLTHSILPYIPPIILPPILPDTFRYLTRECNVPNIDLDSLTNPDPISGDKNNCGPAAAANSLKWLMDTHPEVDDVGEVRDIMDDLEGKMSKDEEGVTWENFVKGKLAFIDENKLPISVKYQVHTPNPAFAPVVASPNPTYGHGAENQTGDTGIPDFDWIANELEQGEDVEIYMTYWCDSAGVMVQRSTHVVNVTGYVAFGNSKWLQWKHDIDQSGPGGTIEEHGQWCIDAAGYPFLKEMSVIGDCIAYVGAAVSESYDPEVVFIDMSQFDWSYRPIEYLSGGIHPALPHAWLEFTIPAGTTAPILNMMINDPAAELVIPYHLNLPLLPVSSPLPMRLKLDMRPFVQSDTLPDQLLFQFHLGDFQHDQNYYIQSYYFVNPNNPSPRPYMTGDAAYIGFHPLIPVLEPLIFTFPPLPIIDIYSRGCEVPNIDLDSMTTASDFNACGPAATANSLQWLENQHDEIDIPIELRVILDSLKRMMKHQIDSGVEVFDIIKGKLEFIDQYRLPIHVKYQAHANAPAEIESPNPIYGHSATNESSPNPDAPPPYVHPEYSWLCQELEAGEDVELVMGFYCDTLITDDEGNQIPKRVRKAGHVINVTGKVTVGPAKWITYKHDTNQRDEGGTSPDGNADYVFTDMSEWALTEGGYAELPTESYIEVDGDTCTAYVEMVVSESYDPSITFCPEKVCFPDDDGPGSLREALLCAEQGATITLGPELANQTIVLTSEPLIITKDVQIVCDPLQETSIKAENLARAFQIMPGAKVVFEGFNIICNNNTSTSCLLNEGELLLRNVNMNDLTGSNIVQNQIENRGQLKIEGNTNIRND